MDTYIVRVSDAGLLDEKLTVKATVQTLGGAIGAAIDQLLRGQSAQACLPLFVDVHAASEFAQQDWMFDGTAEAATPALALRA